MPKKVAITSDGPYVGATTVARELAGEPYWYTHVSMSNYLIAAFADMRGLDYDEVVDNKEFYRAELQEFGPRYDRDPAWVRKMVNDHRTSESLIVEKVRTDEQATELLNMGFVLVKLVISEPERVRRAGSRGVLPSHLSDILRSPAERGLVRVKPHITLNAEAQPYWLARIIDANVSTLPAALRR